MAGTNSAVNRDSYGRTTATVQPVHTPTHSIPYSSSTASTTTTPQGLPAATAAVPVYHNPYAPAPMPTAVATPPVATANSQSSVLSYSYGVYPVANGPQAFTASPSPSASGNQPITPQQQYGQYASYPPVNTVAALSYQTAALNVHPNPVSALPYPGLAALPAPGVSQQSAVPSRHPSNASPQTTLPTGYSTNSNPGSSKVSNNVGSAKSSSTPPTLDLAACHHAGSNKQIEQAFSPIPIPDIPTQFPEVAKMTEVQLQRLLSDDVALTAHAQKTDSIMTVLMLRDQLREANHEFAKNNVKNVG
jgi:hypothetical protein